LHADFEGPSFISFATSQHKQNLHSKTDCDFRFFLSTHPHTEHSWLLYAGFSYLVTIPNSSSIALNLATIYDLPNLDNSRFILFDSRGSRKSSFSTTI